MIVAAGAVRAGSSTASAISRRSATKPFFPPTKRRASPPSRCRSSNAARWRSKARCVSKIPK